MVTMHTHEEDTPIVETQEAPKKPRGRGRPAASGERGEFNHATSDEKNTQIGGIKFRRNNVFDHSGVKRLDIPNEFKNTELVYRFVNDHNGRVDAMRSLGYETVQADHFGGDNVPTTRRVGTQSNGQALNAVLMATPKVWFDERQTEKNDRIKEKESGMRAGATDGVESIGKDFYVKYISISN